MKMSEYLWDRFLTGHDVKKQMREAIMQATTPERKRYRLEKFDQFGVCDPKTEEHGRYFTTPTEEVTQEGEDLSPAFKPLPCPQGNQPIGIFYTQYWSYTGNRGQGSKHLIARPILRHAFLDKNYKFICSGHLTYKRRRGGSILEPLPRVRCLTPKKGASKEDIRATIMALDDVFDESKGFYPSGETVEAKGVGTKYKEILEKTFRTKWMDLW